MFIETQDMSGPSCKDDSPMGPCLQDDGKGRRALLTHIHSQLQKKTKMLLLENVVTGSIQQLTAREATSTSKMWVKVIHGDTIDSGYGGCRRQRGWTFGRNLWKQNGIEITRTVLASFQIAPQIPC